MKEIKGDLLAIKSGILLHQVNCLGITGGLAGALHRKWPDAFGEYVQCCRLNPAIIGSLLLGRSGAITIAHIFGQFNPGPNTELPAVEISLAKLAKQLARSEFQGVAVYAPYKMGCGLGGGDWNQYSALLEKHLPQITIVNNK